MRASHVIVRVRSSLWLIPVLCVLAGVGTASGTLALDRQWGYEALPVHLVGTPTAASAVLSTIAAAMVSLTALVLTITMVVVQLAMGQFSPRIVQRILRDKPSQLAIGLFVATFVHALLTLRAVTDKGDGTGRVPGIALYAAFLLVFASIVALVIYVQHIGQALRVSALIELVGKETRKVIVNSYPDSGEPTDHADERECVVRATRSGVVTRIDAEDIVSAARGARCELELVPMIGEFVPAGAPLFRVHGGGRELDESALREALMMQLEPTLDGDVSYGIRLLVDIAVRSLSESPLQDPTTAVQAIDRLHDILRQLAPRPFPDGVYRDAEGVVRLTVPTISWEGYVSLALEEVRLAGAGSPQVTRKLTASLLEIRDVAPPERRAVIDRELALLARSTRLALDDEWDIEFALTPDAKGIGASTGREEIIPTADGRGTARV
jgi:uncharacterized membrane protein